MKRKWFCRRWPGFLKSALGLLIAGFIFWGFVILLEQNNWIAISALATLVLAFVASWSIREQRIDRKEEHRRLALERIRSWAEETFHALATPSTQKQLPLRINEEIAKLQTSSVKSLGILRDAERLGGTLDDRVRNANFIFHRFISILMGKEQIESFKLWFKVEDDIRPITKWEETQPLIKEMMDSLKEVINSATAELVPKR